MLCYLYRVNGKAFDKFFENNPDSLLRMVQVRETRNVYPLLLALSCSITLLVLCVDYHASSTKGDILGTQPVSRSWKGTVESGIICFQLGSWWRGGGGWGMKDW